MIHIEKKRRTVLLKEKILQLIYLLHKNPIFKFFFLRRTPKIYLSERIREKRFKRLVIFSTFNKEGKVTKNLEFYLSKLYELGSDIILVDTSPLIDESEISRLKPYLTHYIWRENIGYDFGSWKIGLFATGSWEDYEQIVFTNDSVFGPIRPLEPIFHQMESENVDIWGLTDSYEYGYHLMSYFLVFEKEAIALDAFRKFWEELVFYPTFFKKVLIMEYELGGTKYWLRNGFKLGVYIPYNTLNSNVKKDYYQNPTHVYWDRIVKDFGFPFIKRDSFNYLKQQSLDDSIYHITKKIGYLDSEGFKIFDPGTF